MSKENTTGIRDRVGPIPDDHFENDAGAAVGNATMSADDQAYWDGKRAAHKQWAATRTQKND